MNNWINFVKSYANKNNVPYACALSHKECSEQYQASKKKLTRKEIEENRKKYSAYAKKQSTELRKEVRQMLNSKSELPSNPIDFSKHKISESPTINIYKKKKGYII